MPIVWDTLRKTNVELTEEEKVRQWFISVLRDELKVPEHMMKSEVEMHFGVAGKKYRADIVIFNKNAEPLAIIECKKPEVKLTAETLRQALRYDMVLDVAYIIITNGRQTYAVRKKKDSIFYLDHLPSYEEMINDYGKD